MIDEPSKASVEEGKRLIKARKLTYLSRRAFAKKHDFNISTLQAYEEGRFQKGIPDDTLNQFVNVFHQENIECSVNWFKYGMGQPPEKRLLVNIQNKVYTNKQIDKKVDAYAKIKEKNLSLIDAMKNNKLTIIQKLISEGANLHKLKEKELYIYDMRQDTALHYAAMYSDDKIINFFIDIGMHPNIRNRHLDTPLHLACLENNLKAIDPLIKRGANIEASAREGATPLIWCAYLGNLKAAQKLVSLGAKIDNADHLGNTALHWACLNNQTKLIEFLLKAGADCSIINHSNKKPLDWALLNGNKEALNVLLKLTHKF